jgi:hypothetical protein
MTKRNERWPISHRKNSSVFQGIDNTYQNQLEGKYYRKRWFGNRIMSEFQRNTIIDWRQHGGLDPADEVRRSNVSSA